VGADRFGAYAAGGISMIFSDTLGNHELGTSLLVSSRMEETGFAVSYINRTRRWNWGLIGDQTPYVTARFAQYLALVEGQPVVVQEELRQTQVNRGVSAMLQYPFSRAQRVEVSGGLRQIGFHQRLDTLYYSAVSGQFLGDTSEKLPTSDGITLGEAGGALVYDTSIFGATSPILGQSYRLGFTQAAGTIDYSGVLLDYRRYFMPARPFTLAFRGLHYGRYGSGSEDFRLSPVFLGYPGLLRGYDVGSFRPDECVDTPGSSCPVFDDLVGSRMGIASAELRFPLLGVFSRRSYYGAFPVEVAFFADAGVAWDRATEPTFLGGSREWARSVGTAFRFNLLGYIIGEVDYVKPLDRPDRGWLWQFNFTPGF
jgi:outer membrane protein assembly factor BamA